jgi:hypothetical protein
MPGARVIDEAPDSGLLGQFRRADLVIGNLECPMASSPPKTMDTGKIPLWSDATNLRKTYVTRTTGRIS